MPTKKLTARLSGIPRLRIDADIESRQPTRTTNEKQETDENPGMHHVVPQRRIDRLRQHPESPDVSEQTRRNAKRNHVRKRIEFPAKIARRIRQARNVAVNAIEQRRKSYRQRSMVKVRVIGSRSLNALRNRVVARRNIARRKQRRQNVHAAARVPLPPVFFRGEVSQA